MQYLDLPTTLEDMTVSLGMNGVTILSKSRFKARHKGLTDIVQVPRTGFIMKPKKVIDKKSSRCKRRQITVVKSGEIQCNDKPVKIPKYVIDKTEVTNRIKGYLNQMRGEKMLYFWTITFPNTTSEDTAYILLNKWLTRLRTEKMLKEYLWIAEKQENGTVHFHMVINQKMNVQKANKFMRASIMHSINKGEISYSRLDAMRYNGVDIAKDRKTRRVINFAKGNKQKSLTNYLTKYITKNNSTFTHLAWHSSRGYSNLITAVRFTWNEYSKGNVERMLDNDTPIIHEYYTFRRWKGAPPKDLLTYLGCLNHSIQTLLQ
jgi:hypothetical protein